MSSLASNRSDGDGEISIYRASRSDHVTVSQYCPERPYVELRVPKDVATVDCIIFTTVSHDQGFCDNEALIGGYENSNTWFEASVSRPPGRDCILPRMIQTNKVADWEFREHINRWHVSDADTTIRNFITSIRASDVIQVIPRARWPGWRNYMREIRIEAHCKAVLPSRVSEHVASPPHLPKEDISAPTPSDFRLYKSLNRENKEIRLLYLRPGEPDDLISCCLVTTALYSPEVPHFEALSYCWGSPANKKSMNVSIGNLGLSGAGNDSQTQTLSITASLDEALRHLRRTDGTSRLLWVDAVCINQEDIAERGNQVGIMGEIYTKASSVVVWLGESDATAKEAVHLLNTIFREYRRSTATKRGQLPYEDELGDDVEWNEAIYPKLVRVLTQFFNYPWFRRVWVVQEVWLSRKAVIHCGDETVPWESVMLANYWMIDAEGGGFPGIVQEPLPSLWSSIAEHQNIVSSINDLKDPQETTNARMKILDLILEGSVLNATDPKDKIFALLGLGEETHSRDTIPSLLRPDYSKSTSQVYSDFTLWWIDRYKSLAILSAVHATIGRTWQGLHCPTNLKADPVSSDHPSWALSHSGNMKWVTRTLGFYPLFRATGDTTATLELCDPSNTLHLVLAGERIGIIRTIRHYPYSHPQDDDLHRTYLRLFDPAGVFGTWSNAASMPKGTQDDAHSPKYQQLLREHYIAHWGRLPGCKTCQRKPRAQRPGEADCPDDIGFPCLDKCFFHTDEGLMGLCPTGALEGDLIVVLYGGSVPYLLRETVRIPPDSTAHALYKFVGECYVQGRMDGGAVPGQHAAQSAAERFTLV